MYEVHIYIYISETIEERHTVTKEESHAGFRLVLVSMTLIT